MLRRSGLPQSMDSSSASRASSRRMMSAARSRMRPRSRSEVLGHHVPSSNVRRAASTARSTSAGWQSGAVAITSPVAGSNTSNLSSVDRVDPRAVDVVLQGICHEDPLPGTRRSPAGAGDRELSGKPTTADANAGSASRYPTGSAAVQIGGRRPRAPGIGAAIHQDRRAGDVAATGRREERDRRGDLLGPSRAASSGPRRRTRPRPPGPPYCSTPSVWIRPAATQIARIPKRDHSFDKDAAIVSRALRAIDECAISGMPRRGLNPMKNTTPRRRGIIQRVATSWVSIHGASTLRRCTARNPFSEMSSAGAAN